MWTPRVSVGSVPVNVPGVIVALASVHGPCHVSTWKYTASTFVIVGRNVLLALNVNEGVALAVWLFGNVLITVVSGIDCTFCSVRTVTLLLSALATYIWFVTGFTAAANGEAPAATVVATVFVAPSITVTLLLLTLVT